MQPRLTDDWRQYIPQFVELELAASAAYAAFVYGDLETARTVDTFLIESGPCEFGAPHGMVALLNDQVVGVLCAVPGAELATLRLKAATRIARSGAHADPGRTRRVQLAKSVLMKPRQTDLYLSRIAVAPASRGQGVGAFLLGKLMSRAREVKADRCVLEVESGNAPAIRLYSRYGFEILSTVGVDDPDTHRNLSYHHMGASIASV